ncbi:hypothetical protein ACJIZ3_013609 [Penstemon smallii]|uniref:Uncharacterized protein n=1 Tax=Penstemon smallii TaxID=265156 RepID=A0ABD3RKP8_9LAMI
MSSSKDGASDGAAAVISTSKTVEDDAVDSILFEEGEKVLTFHGHCLYDAKVQKVEFLLDQWRYYIHYMGWNNYWDEWLGAERLLKRTEENLQKQKELKEKHAMEKNAKSGNQSQNKTKSSTGLRGKKRKQNINEKESVVPMEKLVNIPIPSTLKQQLVDDNECVTQLGQLVKLPRSPSVFDILNKYFDYRVKKDGMIADTVGEIVKGLRTYFDKALPAMLLYPNERQQYKEMIADNISPSGVYGAEHLLRLFVKLPELLSEMNIEMNTLMDLQHKLVDVLRFLQTNQSTFFSSNYQTSERSSNAVEKEDN